MATTADGMDGRGQEVQPVVFKVLIHQRQDDLGVRHEASELVDHIDFSLQKLFGSVLIKYITFYTRNTLSIIRCPIKYYFLELIISTLFSKLPATNLVTRDFYVRCSSPKILHYRCNVTSSETVSMPSLSCHCASLAKHYRGF